MKPPLKSNKPDDFQTPPRALYALYPHLPKTWTIWECADGIGRLTNAFRESGYNTIGTDIVSGFNFLKDTMKEPYDCIVTNPPYSIKQEFLERCYYLEKPFALLLPLTALETPKRQYLFGKHGLELILFDKRINFEVLHLKGKGVGSWFAVGWFTWKLNIGKQISFFNWDKGEMDLFDD